jgi:hypothetical protein
MIKYFKITTLLFFLAFLTISVNGQKTSREFKQLEKSIKKQWKVSEFEIELLSKVGEQGSSYKPNGRVYQVQASNRVLGYAYIGRVFSCRSGGCAAQPSDEKSDDMEFFDYLILFNTEPSVDYVRVYNYQATHGQEICSPGWLKQFRGYNGSEELDYGNSVDAISGATISAISIIVDIENIAQIIAVSLENYSFR